MQAHPAGLEWLFWWQIPLIPVFLAIAIFGNAALLLVGARFIAKLPNVGYWRCVLAMFLSFIASLLVLPLNAFYGLGLLVTLPLVWLVIMWILKTSYGKAILAWLPTLATLILLVVPLLVAILMPSLSRGREMAKRAGCGMNLSAVGKAVAMHCNDHNGSYPSKIEQIIAEGNSPKYLMCPSTDDTVQVDYFYFAPEKSTEKRVLIACDFYGNHQNYRNCLFSDFSVGSFKDDQFNELLQKPENQEFAQALRLAEKQFTPQE